MTNKQTRFIALLMATSLFMNTVVLPVKAEKMEETTVVTEATTEDTIEVLLEAVTENTIDDTTETTTEATTEETESSADKTEEISPSVDEAALLDAQELGFQRAIDYYRSMPISDDRTMPLEWWYVMTDRVTMREQDDLVLENGELAAQAAENALITEDWSAFLSFPEVISVGSKTDLILLSYVNPLTYQESTISLFDNADLEFDLTTPIFVNEQTLSYQGLGALDAPFSGVVRYEELSENLSFVLDTSLFIGLSSKAVFLDNFDQPNPITLESKATFAFDGLLAQHILGESKDTAYWSVVLIAPELSGSTVYCLPSVLGIIYENTNVNLTLTDNSGLQPSDRGYLCAAMYGDASLDAKNITREVSVPLVGELSNEATLTTDALQSEVSEPKGSIDSTDEAAFFEKPFSIAINEDGTLRFYAGMPEEEFQAIVQYYASLPLIPGQMPLEWWYAECGKLGELRAYLTMKLEQEVPQQTKDSHVDESAALEVSSFNTSNVESDTMEDSISVASADETRNLEDETSSDAAIITYAAAVEGNVINITSVADFNTFPFVNAKDYYDKTILVGLSNSGTGTLELPDDFVGLGREDFPFKGTLKNKLENESGVTYPVVFKTKTPVFQYLSTEATFENVHLISKFEDGTGNLLANNVIEVSGSEEWNFTLDESNTASTIIPPLIGTLKNADNAVEPKLTLTINDISGMNVKGPAFLCREMVGTASLDVSFGELPTFNPTDDYAGILVGTMKGESSLSFTATSSDLTINIANGASTNNVGGNVGGLVGKMEEGTTNGPTLIANAAAGSRITIDINCQDRNAGGLVGVIDKANLTVNTPIRINQIIGNLYVGGLVAQATDPIFTFTGNAKVIGASTDETKKSVIESNSQSQGAAGGIAAKMTLSSSNDAFTVVLPVENLKITNADSGGLFGVVVNNGRSISISYNGNLIDDVTIYGRGYKQGGGACGGLIGWYNANATSSLTVNPNTQIHINEAKDSEYMGGYLGNPQNSHNLTLSGTVTFNSISNIQRFGGVIGGLRDKTSYVKFMNLEVSTKSEVKDNGINIDNYGGLIGTVDDNNGHLVHVVADVNLSNTEILGSKSSGGLIGKMNYGALYMEHTPTVPSIMKSGAISSRGWILGNRGNVLVCSEEKWKPNTTAETNDTGRWGQVLDLSKFNGDLVEVSNDGILTVGNIDKSGDEYVVSNRTEFAKVALRIQLEDNGKLSITDDIVNGSDVKIRLMSDIDLSDTGLTGLTRDNNSGDQVNITVIGNGVVSKKITLPSTTVYAANNDNHHNRQGLINKVGTLQLENLTVTGTPTVMILKNDYIYSAIVDELYGTGTLKNVTSSIEWTIKAKELGQGGDVSGFICKIANDINKLEFKSCIWNGKIQDNTNGDTYSAGFLASDFPSGTTAINVENCTVSGSISKVRNGGNAKVGGLIVNLSGTNSLNITNLTVDGATITTADDTNNASASNSGGLLGYTWGCSKVEFNGVTIQGGSSLNAGKAQFGGLVYRGSGYWKVPEGESATTTEGETTVTTITTNNGGISIKNTSFTGGSSTDTPSGLLVCMGNYESKGLYLEVGDYTKSYLVDGNTVVVNLKTDPEYFDELVGKSIDNINNGIVSIGTNGHALIDQSGCNTYTHQLLNTYNNNKTRYYYNLDSYRGSSRISDGKAASNPIDSAGEMVLLSAWDHCAGNLKSYFYYDPDGKITIKNPTAADAEPKRLNLDGYSYYPIAFRSGMKIEDATINFDFGKLVTAESNNKLPSAATQHAEMHTGIFYKAINDGTEDVTLSISGLTLQGNVGMNCQNSKYGAIICGDVKGKNADAKMKLDFSDITMEGICIYNYSSGVAPLLIHQISSYSTLNLSGVTTESGSYEQNTKAASSLIGNVGSNIAEFIQLTFSGIMLNENGYKNKNCTLFTNALLLQQFEYANQTCSGVYNFKRNDFYTLGQELSNTAAGEVDGRNNGQQYWFFKDIQTEDSEDVTGNYICRAIDENSDPATAFKDFTRYVAEAEGSDNKTYRHELDINLLPTDLIEGCGTYSHPYVIRSGAQMNALAAMLRGTPKSGWKVKVDNAVIANVDFSKQDSHFRKITDTAVEETTLAAETVYECSGGTWTPAENADKLLDYLRSAYYVIKGDDPKNGTNPEIDLGKGWVGLGESAEGRQFRGVIKGWDDNQTIKISLATAQQFGGLIKFSQGSVVKNLKIEYTDNVTITAASNDTGLPNTPSFFGGVVGWCIGGDTIIDNVTVSAAENVVISASGISGWNEAVGGYVGLVGGASGIGGGGVVFRGTLSNSLPIPNTDSNYYNGGIGRVLDGYALSETPEVGSGDKNYKRDKNYKIPCLPTDEAITFGLETSESVVVVSNENGLWALSAMVNSRSGSIGKGRYCQYADVGETDNPGDALADEQDNQSYLSRRCSGFTPPSSMSLRFDGNCDMTEFGNGFRGIGFSHGLISDGTSNGYSTDSWITIESITGTVNSATVNALPTVTLAQSVVEYAGENELWSRMGAGLFPVLNCSGSTSIQNLILAGEINFDNGYSFGYSEKQRFADKPGRIGVGMLAGSVRNSGNSEVSVILNNVQLNGVTIDAPTVPFVGGLIGYFGTQSEQLTALTFTNCSYDTLNVTGFTEVGGLVGFAGVQTVTIGNATQPDALGIQGTTGAIKAVSPNCYYYTDKNNQDYRDGVGGLIGFLDQGVLNASNITLDTLSVNSNADGNKNCSDVGGLVGTWVGAESAEGAEGSISNVTLMGNVEISSMSHPNETDAASYSSAGGLVGLITDKNLQKWNSDKTINVTIGNIHIADQGGTLSVTGCRAGGLLGIFRSGRTQTGNQLTLANIYIGKNDDSVAICHNGGNWSGVGGLTGVIWYKPTVSATNITIKETKVDGGKRSAALLFGTRSDTNGATIRVRNVSAENCTVKSNGEQIGFLYGDTKDMTLYGYNILIKNSSINGNATKSIWGGNGKAYLVAVNAIGCTGAIQDFNNTDANYAIRANFTCANDEGGLPKMPDSPASDLGTLTYINGESANSFAVTGDGAAFVSTTKPIAQEILDTDNTYFGISTEKAYFTDNKLISTYASANGGTLGKNEPNFPVLVVPAVKEEEVTETIFSYLTVLTNQPKSFWKQHLDNITISTFKWENSSFVQQGTPSLSKTDTGIRVSTGEYDNQRNQFTLLDVAFDDPTGSGQKFHLYAPVIVQKLLQFKFWASVLEGTTYNTAAYNPASAEAASLAIGNHGDQFTALINYELQYTKEEWQILIDNGENLLWNFEKVICLDRSGLPNGTMLTLVDRNNLNKAYYNTIGASKEIDFRTVFGLEPIFLCDMMELTVSEKTSNGSYVKTTKSDPKCTIRIKEENDYQYYRPVNEDDEITDRYNITVTSEELLSEQYYLTIQTPAGRDYPIYDTALYCPDTLKFQKDLKGIPTERIPNINPNDKKLNYTRYNDENHMMIGEFLNQEFEVKATNPGLEMSSSNYQLTAKLTATFTIKEGIDQTAFNHFAQKKNLYPQFDLYLDDGEGNIRSIPEGTILEVSYYKNDQLVSKSNPKPLGESAIVRLDGFPDGIPAKDVGSQLKISAKITLTYDSAGINQQFPERDSEQTKGVQICGKSYLSYSKNIRNNAPINGRDNTHTYFRQKTNDASLYYMASVPEDEQNAVNQLGINGITGDSFNINSVAYYDVSRLKNVSTADSLVCRLSFYPKQVDSSVYVNDPVNVPYSASFTANVNGTVIKETEGTPGVISLEGSQINPDVPIRISIPLKIETGSNFENCMYSNYMVKLTVYLTKNGNKIAGSEDDDYIIYTNAKILTTLVQ